MDTNELMHYGVKGMRWGIHRASKQLGKGYATGDTAKVQKATARLEKHRGKAQKKINKLSKTNEQLEKKRDKQIIKNEPKIAELNRKATDYRSRVYNSRFMRDKKANKLMNRAQSYEIEAKRLQAISDRTKAEIAKNARLSSQYSKGIKDIDQAIATKGRDYIKKYAS